MTGTLCIHVQLSWYSGSSTAHHVMHVLWCVGLYH